MFFLAINQSYYYDIDNSLEIKLNSLQKRKNNCKNASTLQVIHRKRKTVLDYLNYTRQTYKTVRRKYEPLYTFKTEFLSLTFSKLCFLVSNVPLEYICDLFVDVVYYYDQIKTEKNKQIYINLSFITILESHEQRFFRKNLYHYFLSHCIIVLKNIAISLWLMKQSNIYMN